LNHRGPQDGKQHRPYFTSSFDIRCSTFDILRSSSLCHPWLRKSYEGLCPFPEPKLGAQEYVIHAELLKPGLNLVEFANTAKSGRPCMRPWFGIDSVTLKVEDNAH